MTADDAPALCWRAQQVRGSATFLVAWVAGVLALGAAMLPAMSERALAQAPSVPAKDGGSIAPTTPWLDLDGNTLLERIAFGSCLDQAKDQPIWKAVLGQRPQLFILMGDNVYGERFISADLEALRKAYAGQARHKELAEVRAVLPFLRIWDDHDYGHNDGGGDFPYKARAAELFHEFWQSKPEHPEGLYHSRVYGPSERRVQIIMLDTRWFRSPLKERPMDDRRRGKYAPDDDPAKTMLGDAQWAWLEHELKKPAKLRIVVSSIQVLADGHNFERWGNLPRERDRLLKLIDATGARGVILLSGDRHFGALYRLERPGTHPLVELTSSSLNRPINRPSKDAPTPERVGEMYGGENFGLVTIDWQAGTVRLALKGLKGQDARSASLSFAELGVGR